MVFAVLKNVGVIALPTLRTDLGDRRSTAPIVLTELGHN